MPSANPGMSLTKRLIVALALMAGIAPAFAQAPPPVPALPDTERRTSYSISGTNCACSVGFALYGDSTDVANWVEVFINGVRVNFNDASFGWALTSPLNPGGLANAARPITDAVLTFTNVQTGTIQIVGARRPRRTTQFSESAGVPARNLNQAFTDIIAMLREDWDKINDVSGRAILAAPGETLALLPAAATRANQGACFDNGGNLVNCVSVPSTTFTAGNGIVFTGVGPTSIKANLAAGPNVTITGTNPLSINVPLAAGPGITLTGSNPLTIGLSATNSVQVFASRAAAAAQNLTGITTLRTLGYSASGDGGGAVFKNIGSSPFIDSFVISGTITSGSGYANATYFGVVLNGSTSVVGVVAMITVAGGGVTAVNLLGTPGNLCKVGDTLTGSFGGGTGFSYLITTCSTPLGSFTDTAGNHFQYVVDLNSYPNIRQFGAKMDFNHVAGDASATDDRNSIFDAARFTAYSAAGRFDLGDAAGGTLLMPQGSSMICSGGLAITPFIVPANVTLKGTGSAGGSVIKMCNAFDVAQHFIELGDPNWHFACFNIKLQSLEIFVDRSVASNNLVFAVHSNCDQDFGGLQDVYIYSGQRGAFGYQVGYGGASTVRLEDVSITSTGSNNMIRLGDTVGSGLNVGTTIFEMKNIALGGPSSGNLQTGPGLVLLGGFHDIHGMHCENIVTCIEVVIPATGNNDMVSLHNINGSFGGGGTACVALIQLDPTNRPGNTIMGMIPASSCTNLIADNQPGGTSVVGATNIGLDIVKNP